MTILTVKVIEGRCEGIETTGLLTIFSGILDMRDVQPEIVKAM